MVRPCTVHILMELKDGICVPGEDPVCYIEAKESVETSDPDHRPSLTQIRRSENDTSYLSITPLAGM